MTETFFEMLRNPAHWAFEIFVTVIFDGLVVGLFWPVVKACWKAHRAEADAQSLAAEEKVMTEKLVASVGARWTSWRHHRNPNIIHPTPAMVHFTANMCPACAASLGTTPASRYGKSAKNHDDPVTRP